MTRRKAKPRAWRGAHRWFDLEAGIIGFSVLAVLAFGAVLAFTLQRSRQNALGVRL